MSSFTEFMSKELPKKVHTLIDSDEYSIEVELMPYTDLLNRTTKDGTIMATCTGKFTITSKADNESVSFEKLLLNVPVKTEQGIVIGGNTKQVVKINKIAPGWYNLPAKKEINEETSEVIENYPSLNFHTEICKVFKIVQKNNIISFTSSKGGAVNIMSLLTILTGKTPGEIKMILGDYPNLMSTINNFKVKCVDLDGRVSRKELEKLAKHFSFTVQDYMSNSQIMEFISNRFNDSNRFDVSVIGEEQHRIRSSFAYRAKGLTLAEEVKIDSETFNEGTALSIDILNKIDSSDIKSIYVFNSKGSKFKLLKLPHDDKKLTVEELLTELNMYLATSYGCGVYDNVDISKARTLIGYEKRIITQLKENIEKVTDKIEAEMSVTDLRKTYNKVITSNLINLDLDVIINEQRSSDNPSSQQADLNNIIAYMAKENRVVSDLNGRGSMSLKAVQKDHYNHIDPCDSVEGKKVGLVHTLALHTVIDPDTNQTKTPYIEIKNCKAVSEEPVYLTAMEQENKYIAQWNETFENELIYVAYNGVRTLVPREKVTLQSYSPLQTGSYARNLIPFQGELNPKRLVMGVNHLKQAVPVIGGERPLVSTGVESLNVDNTSFVNAYTIIKEDLLSKGKDKELTEEQLDEICSGTTITPKSIIDENQYRKVSFTVSGAISKYFSGEYIVEKEYPFMKRSSQESIFSYNLNKEKGSYINKDIVLVNVAVDISDVDLVKYTNYGHYDIPDETLKASSLAIGVNLKVAYKTMGSGNIDDAIVISDRIAELGSYSMVLKTVKLSPTEYSDVNKNEVVFEEEFWQSPNANSYKYDKGIPIVGAYLGNGDPICYIKKTNRIDNADKSIVEPRQLDEYTKGVVMYSKVSTVNNQTYLDVILVDIAFPYVGDKLSGRFGNKGVISRIEKASRMPYDSITGEPVDVCLNPLGIPSRMNIGQFYEVALAASMAIKKKHAVVSPFRGQELQEIKRELEEAKVREHVLYDGLTCKPFHREVFWGVEYILKAEHQINKKAQSSNLAAISHETFLPVKGRKNKGGQTIGEMEVWALDSAGAFNVLQDIMSSQSSDQAILGSIKKDIMMSPRDVKFGASSRSNTELKGDNNNNTDFLVAFRCMGINLTSDNGVYGIEPLTDEYMKKNFMKITSDKEGLYDDLGIKQTSFNSVKLKSDWRYMSANHRYINPYVLFKSDIPKFILGCRTSYLHNLEYCLFTKQMMAKLFAKKSYIIPCDENNESEFLEGSVAYYSSKELNGGLTGIEAILYLFENTDLNNTLAYHKSTLNSDTNSILMCNPNYDVNKAVKISTKRDLPTVREIRNIENYLKKGITLKDFIVSNVPVIPLLLRKEATATMKANDMSWFYHRIINTIPRTGTLVEKEAFLRTMIDFTGATPEQIDYTVSDNTRHSIATKYFGKGIKDHGQIRDDIYSHRVHFGARSVITPTPDASLAMDEIGLPYIFCADIYKYHLIADLSNEEFLHTYNLKSELKLSDNFTYNEKNNLFECILDIIISEKPEMLKKCINLKHYDNYEEVYEIFFNRFIDFCTRQVVISGRQPTLHKYGIRAFHVVPTPSKTIVLNPLVCDAYNADFDGDQMWIIALLRKVSQREALLKLGTMRDALNPKDSSPTIKHNQDVLLGAYGMTMLKDNCTDILEYTDTTKVLYVPSVSVLEGLIQTKLIAPHDLVLITHNGKDYMSTAGRILFNACLGDKGFTDKPFSNPNNLPLGGNGSAGLFDLLLDGILCKKVPGDTEVNAYYRDKNNRHVDPSKVSKEYLATECTKHYASYCSLVKFASGEFNKNLNKSKQITKMKTGEVREVSVVADLYENIMKFGFYYCDFLGMSLGFYDFEENHNTKADKERAKKLERQMFKYYSMGLISEKTRIDSILEINKQLNSKFEKNVMSLIPRSNNLFITTDSGAKGNSSQIKMIVASVGVSMKTLNEPLESPITNNYSEGMDCLDIFLASYGIRMGFISTQDGAPQAGYATRQGEYMLNGIKVKYEDCGNDDQEYELTYSGIKSFQILKDGKVIEEYPLRDSNGKLLDMDVEPDFNRIVLNNRINLNDDSMRFYFCKGDFRTPEFSHQHIKVVKKQCIRDLHFNDFDVKIKYKLSNFDKSTLLHRTISKSSVLNNLPSDVLGRSIEGRYFVNKSILDYIEEQNFETVKVRTTHQCHTSYGVCQMCYGLRYDNLEIPHIGRFVGSETAQSIGEPSSQITISLVNQGGAADGSIDQGVKMFKYMLNGNLLEAVSRSHLAPYDGYVSVTPIGSKRKVTVTPISKSGENSNLYKKFRELNIEDVPEDSSNKVKYVLDSIGENELVFTTTNDKLIVQDGEFVREGQRLTDGKIHPQMTQPSKKISGFKVERNKSREGALVYSVYDIKDVVVKVEKELSKFYYGIFVEDSNIELNARHFELLSKVQSTLVDVFHKDYQSSLQLGDNMEIWELDDVVKKDALELDTSLVIFDVSDINSVIRHFTGPFAALGFERQFDNLSKLVTSQDIKQHPTMLNGIVVGEDVTQLENGVVEKKDFNATVKNMVGAESTISESSVFSNEISNGFKPEYNKFTSVNEEDILEINIGIDEELDINEMYEDNYDDDLYNEETLDDEESLYDYELSNNEESSDKDVDKMEKDDIDIRKSSSF